MASQFEQLVKAVVAQSESSDWITAKGEWTITDVSEDEDAETQCVCGQENLRYLYTIQNQLNDNVLFPIGSQCIKQFDETDLANEVITYRKLLELKQAVDSKKFITLDSTYFSKKLIKYLYDEDAFRASQYNNYDPHKDYEFMLKMFNEQKDPTNKQQKKIKALIMSAIIPFAKTKIKTDN